MVALTYLDWACALVVNTWCEVPSVS